MFKKLTLAVVVFSMVSPMAVFAQIGSTGGSSGGSSGDTTIRPCTTDMVWGRNMETGEIQYGFSSTCMPKGWERYTPPPAETKPVCAQVVTPGWNPKTGETKVFPSSCLPDGWIVVPRTEPVPDPTPRPDPLPLPPPTPVCAQVITEAVNLKTGEIKKFPTSCLPDGWVVVASTQPVPSPTPRPTPTPTPKPTPVCAQVITKGMNLKTGEIREFPTSCLPDGWVIAASTSPAPKLRPTPMPAPTPKIDPAPKQTPKTVPLPNPRQSPPPPPEGGTGGDSGASTDIAPVVTPPPTPDTAGGLVQLQAQLKADVRTRQAEVEKIEQQTKVKEQQAERTLRDSLTRVVKSEQVKKTVTDASAKLAKTKTDRLDQMADRLDKAQYLLSQASKSIAQAKTAGKNIVRAQNAMDAARKAMAIAEAALKVQLAKVAEIQVTSEATVNLAVDGATKKLNAELNELQQLIDKAREAARKAYAAAQSVRK